MERPAPPTVRSHSLAGIDTVDERSIGLWSTNAVDVDGALLASLRDALAGAVPLRTSPVTEIPGGWLTRIDDLPDDAEERRRLGDIADEHLVEHELDAASIRIVPVDGLADLDPTPRAVVLRLFPAPGQPVDRDWVDLAAEWVFGDKEPDEDIALRVLGVELRVPARDVGGVLHDCVAHRAWVDVMSGDVTARVRSASLSFGIAPHVALATGGPGCDDRALVVRFELLRELARSTPAAYRCLDVEERFGDAGAGLATADWPDAGGASANVVAGRLLDRAVPEAYPFQVIDAVFRGALPRILPDWVDVRDTPDGRLAVSIGDPAGWLPDDADRDDWRSAGQEVLASLLLAAGDVDDDVATTPATTAAPGDDVDVVIEAAAHHHRGQRLTVLELAAWLADQPHRDAPTGVSPVVATLARNLGSGLGHDDRQRLRPLAGRLVGTETAGDDRVWRTVDHVVRSAAPDLLAAAGLREGAARLRELPRLGRRDAGDGGRDDAALVRAVGLLAASIVTGARRLDLLPRTADVDIDDVAWEVWEDAAARSGWAAMVDTVGVGAPSHLLFAVDAAVLDAINDPVVRARLERRPRALADLLWRTAIDEVARRAWADAWDAAEALIHHDVAFSLRTTIRRSWERMPDAHVHLDLADVVDAIDRAATERIGDRLLEGPPEDWWAFGLEAAGAVDGGDRWRQALREAEDALGEVFADGERAARQVLTDAAADAASNVARAVVAAAVRGAGSVAGRAFIARRAAETARREGDEDRIRRAAEAVAWTVVGPLVDSALGLLESLLADGPDAAPT